MYRDIQTGRTDRERADKICLVSNLQDIGGGWGLQQSTIDGTSSTSRGRADTGKGAYLPDTNLNSRMAMAWSAGVSADAANRKPYRR